ncbi:Bug family tripartite tricarboxylate transporter substrate binding protein [Rhodoplanes sp. Z2-YC6860]|uniref:Bug family tripartite tricarboxylate transporter substrate binding protein n=1 Tax=Rhodoplanes sp. Z2-YC6860 TaxID=674703 RepID=UPI00078C8C8A|nr:tripartite tricarboxylate transporter substrate binding protein [Rhodoplanes sp. Z2-YC6860]AMN40990.1 extra-cytoplasmic solute receptor [Rhodoplanes sp. Z2-YC6860]
MTGARSRPQASNRTAMLLVLGLAALGTTASPAAAQDWPGSKPIKFIVPFPAGGGTDILSRVIAQRLTETRKWSIFVENVGGAGGNIGANAAAKSPHDGYTMVMGQTSNLVINPALYSKLPYDPQKEFAPVVLVAELPVVLLVRSGSPLKSLQDLIGAAKAKPGEITFATPGKGTVSHLAGELIKQTSKIDLQHVPYRGASQAAIDTISGQTQVLIGSLASVIAQIRSGDLRALAVTSARRSEALPDVPTVAEQGLPNFVATTWYGVLVPAGTPRPIVNTLNAAINAELGTPSVREKIALEGGVAIGGTPEHFADVIKADSGKWAEVVRVSGAKVD